MSIKRMHHPLIAAVAAIALLVAGSAMAGPHEKHDPLARMTEQLELTDDQREAFDALRAGLRETIAAVREHGAWPSREAHADLHAAMEAHRNDVHAVLTEAQRAKLDEMRAQQRTRGPRRLARGESRGLAWRGTLGAGPVLQDLDLSDAQRAEIRALLQSARQDQRARQRALNAEIREVLTDAQRAELDARRAARREAGTRSPRRRHRNDG